MTNKVIIEKHMTEKEKNVIIKLCDLYRIKINDFSEKWLLIYNEVIMHIVNRNIDEKIKDNLFLNKYRLSNEQEYLKAYN